jgi:hypothetical protein
MTRGAEIDLISRFGKTKRFRKRNSAPVPVTVLSLHIRPAGETVNRGEGGRHGIPG